MHGLPQPAPLPGKIDYGELDLLRAGTGEAKTTTMPKVYHLPLKCASQSHGSPRWSANLRMAVATLGGTPWLPLRSTARILRAVRPRSKA